MRRAVFVLLLAPLAASAPLRAQRPTPSGIPRPPMHEGSEPPTRFLQRMHDYMNWGMAIGAVGGFATGLSTTPANNEREARLITHIIIGGSVGNLAGLVAGLYERQPSDTLPARIPDHVLRSPVPVYAAQIDNLSDYAWMGGRIGASIGAISGVLLGRDEGEQQLLMLLNGLTGFSVGLLGGGITWAVKRAGS